MKFNIKTDLKKFYRQFLELLSGIAPLNTLRKRELDLLGIYMYYNYKFRNLDEYARSALLASPATRKQMQEDLDMGPDVFNNNIYLIRKTGLISKDGGLDKNLHVYPSENFRVEFNFKIDMYV